MNTKRWFLVLLLASGCQAATTGNDVVASVRLRSVVFDTTRFSARTVILPLINDAQRFINTIARPNEAESVYALTEALRYKLPANYLFHSAAILNPDPEKPVKADNRRIALQYIPSERWGKEMATWYSRPQQWKIFGDDSLEFNVGSTETEDTVCFEYFRKDVPLDTLTDTIDLPDRYIPLLVDYVVAYCMDRILLQSPSRADTEERLRFFEQQLLGRPPDEK